MKIDIDTYKLFSSSLDTIEINISGTEYIFTFNWQIILMSMHENDHWENRSKKMIPCKFIEDEGGWRYWCESKYPLCSQ